LPADIPFAEYRQYLNDRTVKSRLVMRVWTLSDMWHVILAAAAGKKEGTESEVPVRQRIGQW
jgi:hypothetical protein